MCITNYNIIMKPYMCIVQIIIWHYLKPYAYVYSEWFNTFKILFVQIE